MTWAADRRLDYIDWRLLTVGSIRREHIMRTFSVSAPQASGDLTAFQAAHPEAIRYDKSGKSYVPARMPYRSVRGHDDPEVKRALTLLANAGHPMGFRD